jgi:20S proteasome subunit alpha 7
MTWVSSSDGPTKGRHEEVPKHLREQAEELAKKALTPDDEEDEEEEKKDKGEAGEKMEE